MGYETAPATLMVATHCAVCSRPLVDAISVETGIGPECRKKYGYNAKVSEEARAEANKLVHGIALAQEAVEVVLPGCERLRALGFSALADRILTRVATVIITETDGVLSVKTPYDPAAVFAQQRVPGRRWDPKAKRNTYPVTSKPALYAMLQELYAGKIAIGPKGGFLVPAKGQPAVRLATATLAASTAPAAAQAVPRPPVDPYDYDTLVRENLAKGLCPDGCCGREG